MSSPHGLRWEYRKLTLDWSDVAQWEQTLDAFGAEGWELTVAATPPAPIGYTGMTAVIPPLLVVLKRPRST